MRLELGDSLLVVTDPRVHYDARADVHLRSDSGFAYWHGLYFSGFAAAEVRNMMHEMLDGIRHRPLGKDYLMHVVCFSRLPAENLAREMDL